MSKPSLYVTVNPNHSQSIPLKGLSNDAVTQ